MTLPNYTPPLSNNTGKIARMYGCKIWWVLGPAVVILTLIARLLTRVASSYSTNGLVSSEATNPGAIVVPARSEAHESVASVQRQEGPPLPFVWVHIPKTGSSFLNVLMTHGCNSSWDARLKEGSQIVFWWGHNMSRGCERAFSSLPVHQDGGIRRIPREPFHLFDNMEDRAYPGPPGHTGYAPYAKHLQGHGVTMLRRAEQRLLSGYYHKRHSYTGNKWGATLPMYLSAQAGCVVKMLGRKDTHKQHPAPCTDHRPPTPEEEVRAASALSEFAFVGIVEEWNLSVCLFHRMFSTRDPWWLVCESSHFVNQRPGKSRNNSDVYPTDVLDGFVDVFDRRLYAQGRRAFVENLRLHGVNKESCAPCFEASATVVQ